MLLVTGGTGFVGKNLMAGLLKKGNDIRLLCLPGEDVKEVSSHVEIARGDITKPESLKTVAKDVDTVVHLAGMVSYTKPKAVLYSINAAGTKNLLECCKNADRFIFSSSVSVYGEISGKADENYQISPATPYGESKALAEKLILNSGIKHVILRIAPAYGKGSPSWLKNLKLLERGFPIPNTQNKTHVVHVSDFVQALQLAVKKGEGIYNIADREPMPFVQFAETVVRHLGKKPRRMPFFLVNLLARLKGMKTYLDVLTMNRNYVIDKARKELGFRPKANFEREVGRMVDWYLGIE
jgi:nucleoside-diphosphate-sugar epimerase